YVPPPSPPSSSGLSRPRKPSSPIRRKTESGNVVCSHSSAWGASSFTAKLRIDSRSASCSSVKMKCLRLAWKSGLRTLSTVAMGGSFFVNPKRFAREVQRRRLSRGRAAPGRATLGARPGRRAAPRSQTLTQERGKVNSRAAYFPSTRVRLGCRHGHRLSPLHARRVGRGEDHPERPRHAQRAVRRAARRADRGARARPRGRCGALRGARLLAREGVLLGGQP